MNILLILIVLLRMSPSTQEEVWTAEELALANTAINEKYLTKEEKKTIMIVNLARLDGKRYLESYFQQHNNTPFDKMSSAESSYMRSLKKDLENVKGLPMLKPEPGLCKSAKYHAKDSGKNNIVGHTSSDGTSFGKRLPKYVKGWNKLAENCSYGYDDAINIVGQLLLDQDVPSLGHRKNIMDPTLQYIGVSIQPHDKYRHNCVMDFCAKFDN